jgi:uncharacterized membrane protein YfcA
MMKIKAAATALPTQVVGNATSAAVLIASLSMASTDQSDSCEVKSNSSSTSDTVIDLANVAAIALPATISVAFGTRLGSRLSDTVLKLLFGLTLAGVAPLIWHKACYQGSTDLEKSASFSGGQPHLQQEQAGEVAVKPAAGAGADRGAGAGAGCSVLLEHLRSRGEFALAGTAMGFITGLVGVGGGPIIISYLSLQSAQDLTPRQVVGTANLSMLPMMLVGVASHALQGNVVWRAAAPLCVATVAGGAAGGLAAAHAPVQVLQAALGGFLVVTGCSTASKALRVLLRR